jgi:hypothetical protein
MENHLNDANGTKISEKGILTESNGESMTNEDGSLPVIELVKRNANSTLNHNDKVLQNSGSAQNPLTNNTASVEGDDSTSHFEVHPNTTTTVSNAIHIENTTTDTTSDS